MRPAPRVQLLLSMCGPFVCGGGRVSSRLSLQPHTLAPGLNPSPQGSSTLHLLPSESSAHGLHYSSWARTPERSIVAIRCSSVSFGLKTRSNHVTVVRVAAFVGNARSIVEERPLVSTP